MAVKFPILFLGLLLIYASSEVSAQPDHFCGTDKLHQELLDDDPDYVNKRKVLEAFTQGYVTQNAKKAGTVYVIPTVVHIIHNFGSENISKQQVLDGMKTINDAFRKTSPDTVDIVTAFKGIAADSEIEFRLAQLDPNGNCTDGITRTVSSQTMSADNGVKSLVRWPNDRYLNVWVVNTIASGAGGYAYYPGASPAIDGIVLLAGAFGAGKHTLTHEAGHYLNLPHTWGSTNDPGVASNCNSDDGVSDTPNTIGNNTCNLSVVTCGSLDNVQNYMEYTFCYRMFTEGQKAKMRAALNSSASNRNNLWTPSNLVLTGTDGPQNLCKVAFSSSQQVICVGSSIDFQDESYNGQSDWSWGFPGGTPSSSGDPDPSIIYNSPGVYNVSLSVTNGTDVIVKTKPSFVIVQSEGDALPLFESFEGFDFTDEIYWERENGDSSTTWETVSFVGYSGTSSLKIDNYNGNEDGRSDFLISPSFDLSDMQSVDISFQVAFAQKIDTTKDALRVYVSNDCGASWALRYVESGASLATVATTNSPFTPIGSAQWQQHVINLDASLLVDGFKFKIEYLHKGGNNLYLDDINISGNSNAVPMLVSPTNGMVDQNLSLTIDWNAVNGVDAYEYQIDTQMDFGSSGLITGTHNFIANVDNGADTEHSLVNLAGSTTYYWKARTISSSVNSNWSAIWEFTTMSTVGIEDGYLHEFNYAMYPNPSSGQTKVVFTLRGNEQVEIVLVDLMGREILKVYDGSLSAGTRVQKIPKVETPGIYFVKLRVGGRFFVKKLIVKS